MAMTCEQFRDILMDLDRKGTEGYALREEALRHAEECGDCAGILTESESLSYGLETLARLKDTYRAPLKVEAALVKRFRRESEAAAEWKLRRLVLGVGVAASVIFVIGIAINRRPLSAPEPYRSTSISEPPSSLPEPHANPAPSPSAGIPLVQIQSKPRSTPPSTARTPRVAEVLSREAQEFYWLPFADDSADAEEHMVVRVALTRPALAAYGLPVMDASDSSPVSAELLLGEDGMPQAIRLLGQENSH
jgi:hypothetical protein